MSCLGLNCRGLGNPSVVAGLRNLFRKDAPSMIFLSETKLSSSEFGRIKHKLGDFHALAVDSRGQSGGLALLWKKDFDVTLRSMSTHHIDVEIQGGIGEAVWRFTGFYG